MKGIIVDDEARSRRMLQTVCEDYCEGLEIIGQAASVEEAKKLISKEMPDLVFLDIRMPFESGFELLKSYDNKFSFEVIFTTAYEEYAVKAFEFAAIDYLLKPIDIDELVSAVNRVKELTQGPSRPEKFEFLLKLLEAQKIEKIALVTSDGYHFVNYRDIIRLEGDSNYTTVILSDGGSHLITKTLKHFEQLLSTKGFCRVHKSHLINLHATRQFIKAKKGGTLEMINGDRVEVSATKREGLIQELENLK